MTGVFAFAIMTVLVTLNIVALASTGQLVTAVKETAASAHFPADFAKQFEQITSDPASLTVFVVMELFLVFMFLAVSCSLGGALGARLTQRKPS
jgi:hypothetical protein